MAAAQYACIKCKSQFTFSSSKYFSCSCPEKHITYDYFCIVHPDDSACLCIKQKKKNSLLHPHVMTYPYAGSVVCYCDVCLKELKHTCDICKKVVDTFKFEKICFDCAKCIKVQCIKCNVTFDFDASDLCEYQRPEFKEICLLHLDSIYCECANVFHDEDVLEKPASVKDHLHVNGVPLECKECTYAKEHMCSSCKEIVDEFSYPNVCYDCDNDAFCS